MSRRLTTEEFIEKAKKVHDNEYDYSKVSYINNNTKVCIICPEHGEFWQKPSIHLRGHGCPICGAEKCVNSRKYTTEDFIEKAKKIHGDKYGYSKVEYINNSTKVCIICPIHGEFWQSPSDHLNGRGCFKCGREKIIAANSYSTEEFIEKAIKVHGDKYDYSKVEYINSYIKVCIICPEHGEFWQSPNKHLLGQGCIKCAGVKKLDRYEFIWKAIQKHGYKYDYRNVDYVNYETKVHIVCPIHGKFFQKSSDHLNGRGCALCNIGKIGNNIRFTTEEFIKKAKEIHGDRYDYSKVNYVALKSKICIICPEHGEFWQTGHEHFDGCGCPKCCGKNKTTEDFIDEANTKHGYKYDYSKVNYISSRTKICIICPIHGEFWQTPNKHLTGCGCPICNESTTEKALSIILDENSILYDRQKRFKWLKYKNLMSLDFYLPDYNIAIECQGIQHFESVDYFGGEDSLIKTIERDELKYNQCKEHGIEVLYYTNVKVPENYENYVYTDKNMLLEKILSK